VAHGVATMQAALLAQGQELYALNCAVCHGRTGGGLAEAKLAFPPDHRNCTRCHRPTNRVVQPLTQPFEDNNMFSLGDPPALHPVPGAGPVLAGVADPSALLAYVSATMPRYDPGRMTPEEYTAITAHLLALNGRTDEIAMLQSLPSLPSTGE
jgi:mono/diheme cytochrome c family protein